MKYCCLILILLICGLTTEVFASKHYIDKYATGNNDGTSWLNAWENFSAIFWNNINPGDTIFISGGIDSTIYYEQLNISKSGTSDNPLVITKGTDTGHAGKVIIDGLTTYANAIIITDKQYIIVSSLYLRNSEDTVLKIRDSKSILIDNCNLHTTTHAGIETMGCEKVTIRKCVITTGSYIIHQTDGIYSQDNLDNIYENNYIVINNDAEDGHNDCIQSFQDYPLIIRNNYIEQNNDKTSNAQGIYIESPLGSDTTKIYNNIFNSTLASSNGITFTAEQGNPSARVQIVSNTVYGKNIYSQYYLRNTVDPIIKNNIGYSENGTSILRLLNVSFTDPSYVDNNIWKSSDNEPISVNSGEKSWNSWQASGFDLHSYRANPDFNDILAKDFTLKSTSVGVDHGQTLYPPYTFDINGITRFKGNGWDIGAYESDFTASVNNGDINPTGLELFQNYPNPFNPNTVIRFTISDLYLTTLKVYSVLGEEIATLINEIKPAGSYEFKFEADGLPSGVYFYKLKSGSFIETKKMILMK